MLTKVDIEKINKKFDSMQTECSTILDLLEEKQKKMDQINSNIENLIKARTIITEIGRSTQEKLKDFIESMVTKALQIVFEKDYRFRIDFIIKRNKTEAEIKILFNNIELNPRDECGGGVLDVISFIFRLVLWSLQKKKTSNVFIFDEPFKFLHNNEVMENVVKLLTKLQQDLKLQLIIVTQIEELFTCANKIFEVIHNGQYSIIKELN